MQNKDSVNILRYIIKFPYGLAVRIPGFHPGGPGSTPGMGINLFIYLFFPNIYYILTDRLFANALDSWPIFWAKNLGYTLMQKLKSPPMMKFLLILTGKAIVS